MKTKWLPSTVCAVCLSGPMLSWVNGQALKQAEKAVNSPAESFDAPRINQVIPVQNQKTNTEPNRAQDIFGEISACAIVDATLPRSINAHDAVKLIQPCLDEISKHYRAPSSLGRLFKNVALTAWVDNGEVSSDKRIACPPRRKLHSDTGALNRPHLTTLAWNYLDKDLDRKSGKTQVTSSLKS